jgi:hypothetical protein
VLATQFSDNVLHTPQEEEALYKAGSRISALVKDRSAETSRMAALAQVRLGKYARGGAVDAMSSEDPAVWRRLVDAMWVRSDAPPPGSVEFLKKVVNEGDEQTREKAIDVLSHGPTAAEVFKEFLKSNKPAVRAAAIDGLALLIPSQGRPVLEDLIKSPDPVMRMSAATALDWCQIFRDRQDLPMSPGPMGLPAAPLAPRARARASRDRGVREGRRVRRPAALSAPRRSAAVAGPGRRHRGLGTDRSGR